MRIKALIAALAALAVSGTAHAQVAVAAPNEDARRFGECLVAKTTGEDRIAVMRWMASAIASAGATDDFLTVDESKRDGIDRQMAAVFQRLFTVDCVEQARPLMAARDQQGFEAAGGMLGQIAMRELTADPAVQAALLAYTRHVDPAAFAAFQP